MVFCLEYWVSFFSCSFYCPCSIVFLSFFSFPPFVFFSFPPQTFPFSYFLVILNEFITFFLFKETLGFYLVIDLSFSVLSWFPFSNLSLVAREGHPSLASLSIQASEVFFYFLMNLYLRFFEDSNFSTPSLLRFQYLLTVDQALGR